MPENRISTEYPPDQYPFRIKDWDRFQRYKFRNPPWIKLHVNTLQSEDWVLLDDASKLLAIVLMLIASQHEGFLPKAVLNADYLKRIGNFSKKPKIKPLIENGFLVKMHTDAPTCTPLHPDALQSKLQSREVEVRKNPSQEEPRIRLTKTMAKKLGASPEDCNVVDIHARGEWQ